MDGLRLDPGALGQAFRGTAGRCTERDSDGLREKDLEDGVDQGRLADAGTTGDHQHLGNEGDANSLSLAVGERQFRPLLDPGDRLFGVNRRPGRLPDCQRVELLGDLPFGPIEPGEEHAAPAIEIVGDNRTFVKLEAERGVDEFGRNLQKLVREREKFLGGETAMPFVHGLGKRVGDAGAYADQCRLLYAKLGRDLVSRAEADAADVASQAIRVL